MSIAIETDEKKTSLCIDGELTIYSAQEYRKSIIAGFSAHKTLDVDMTDVDEIDTSGLQLLLAMNKELVTNGSEMTLVSVSDVTKDAIQVSRLSTDLKGDLS